MSLPGSHHATYAMQQSVDLFQWVAEDRPIVREKYDRVGLALVESIYPGGRWQREINEYVLGAEYLGALASQKTVSRDALAAQHSKMLKGRRIPFGLAAPLLLFSEARNSDPSTYSLTPEPAPVPQDVLYLPTVLPGLPPAAVPQGDSWPGSIRLGCRGGVFPTRYSAKVVGRVQGVSRINLSFEGVAAKASSDVVALAFTVTGSADFELSVVNAEPVTTAGEIQFRLNAKYENMSGRPMDVDWLGGTYRFGCQRIVVPFDEQSIFPSGWKRTEAARP